MRTPTTPDEWGMFDLRSIIETHRHYSIPPSDLLTRRCCLLPSHCH